MSIRLMSAVWALDVLGQGETLVLLALADWANDDGHCYPSMSKLSRKCRMTERGCRAIIAQLCKNGHLTRHEVIGKGVNYYVHPGKGGENSSATGTFPGHEPAAHHYVYRLSEEETGRFYIGLRSCECSPDQDDYEGSGEWPKANRGRLIKSIVGTYSARELAAKVEQTLVEAALSDPLCMNRKRQTPETASGGKSCRGNELPKTPEAASANTSGTTKGAKAPSDAEKIVSAWNEMAKRSGLSEIRSMGKPRKAALRQRLKDFGLEAMLEGIERLGKSDWCCGRGPSNWRANFDFLLQASSFAKLIEGSYDNKGATSGGKVVPIRDLTAADHEWAAKYQAERDPQKAAFHRREAQRLGNLIPEVRVQ